MGVAQTAEVNKRVPGVFYDDPDYKCRLVIRTQPPEVLADANPLSIIASKTNCWTIVRKRSMYPLNTTPAGGART